MTNHRVTTHPSPYKGDQHVRIDQTFRYGDMRLNFLYTDAEHVSRRETGGPMLPGPHMGCFALPVVIDNYGGSGREADENRAAGMEFDLADGDTIELPDGQRFEVNSYQHYGNGYPRLTPTAYRPPATGVRS